MQQGHKNKPLFTHSHEMPYCSIVPLMPILYSQYLSVADFLVYRQAETDNNLILSTIYGWERGHDTIIHHSFMEQLRMLTITNDSQLVYATSYPTSDLFKCIRTSQKSGRHHNQPAMATKKSKVWRFFIFSTADKYKAICKSFVALKNICFTKYNNWYWILVAVYSDICIGFVGKNLCWQNTNAYSCQCVPTLHT